MGNIIRNSIEALRGKGLIRIASDQENGSARIHITDNGPGIPEAIRDHLFDPFVTSGKAGGTGLGTAISKSIVDAHGGRLDFNTETGKGTTFVITLPRITDKLGAAVA